MDKKEVKLNIGCGIRLVKDFINVDKYIRLEDLLHGEKTKQGIYANAKVEEGAEFIQGDILDLPFEDNYADYILCVDVIEHIRMREVPKALSELYRVLKPGGKMTMMTTDFDDLVDIWNELRKKPFDVDKYLDVVEIIYGNQAGFGEAELHKSAFNADFLNLSLQTAGFKKYELTGYKRGSLHPIMGGYFKEVEGRALRSSMFVVNATK
ncbi:MAG: methyltransferase domain-containing protein [Thermodesulfobacteriota bacterium]